MPMLDFIFSLRKLEKSKQVKDKVTTRKGIIKIKAEINETEKSMKLNACSLRSIKLINHKPD